MPLKVSSNYLGNFVTDTELAAIAPECKRAFDTVISKNGAGSDFLGWYDLPESYDKNEFSRIKAAAEKIQHSCDIFIVIGIGGSYLGARAAIEFCTSPLYNSLKKSTPDIYFAGNNISASQMKELLSLCEGREVCVNVISKSGKTTEPAIAFRIFREYLEKRYGESEAKERIFVTTDKARGTLRELADEKGYESFVVPDDVGGRYSVLTAVGLLPIAVAGIDISELMAGAMDARKALSSAELANNECLKYAAIRNILYRKNYTNEILVGFEPSLALTAEWWKQLYGESEGKDGKGIFPASVIFSTDLHSMGQLIQQGRRDIFETVIDIEAPACDMVVPDGDDGDGLAYLTGRALHDINRTAFKATALSHLDGGVPNIVLSLSERSARTFGELVFFFELGCAVSGYILGVNPFDQPGVEGYKNNMYALLGKPGAEHEALRAELLKKIN